MTKNRRPDNKDVSESAEKPLIYTDAKETGTLFAGQLGQNTI